MKYTIIADSCCDLYGEQLSSEKLDFFTVAITLTLGEDDHVDNEGLDTKSLIEKMRASKTLKTACPSPEAFMQHMRGRDNIIVVTLSSKLSGTYGSAMIACETIKEEFPDKKVFILDTLSASAGITHILFELKKLIEETNLTFDEIVGKIIEASRQTRARFLLQDLGNLVKTGRLKKVVGAVFGITPLKLICGDDGEGQIKKFGTSLGTKKGLINMSKMAKGSSAVITHCNNELDASYLKGLLEAMDIKVKTFLMRGVSSFYANNKGLVLAYRE